MRKSDPRQLALDLLDRSPCTVQVSAVLVSRGRVSSWGWNHAGADGLGEHAEIATIRRSNRNRLPGSEMIITGRRVRNGKIVVCFPCEDCLHRLQKNSVKTVHLQDRSGKWFGVRI